LYHITETRYSSIGINASLGYDDLMNSHASLSSPDVQFDPIRPVPLMGPYEQCWCKSGKKYKWCHFRREQQERVNIFELESQMFRHMQDGYCSYPNTDQNKCSDIITKSHTIQRRGGLAAIAEDGHVLTVKPILKDLVESKGNPSPRKIGVSKASVFPGFCSKHDSDLFRSIEGKNLQIGSDTAFLFAYRAIAYERFAKDAQRRGTILQREMDKGRPFPRQAAIQLFLQSVAFGIELGIRDVEQWKQEYDSRLLSGSRERFHFLAVKFDRVLPTVACGAFHPEFDFNGKQLQKLGSVGADFEHVAFTLTAFDEQSVAIFGWVGQATGPASAFVASFKALDDNRKASALIRLLFAQTDNIFIQPSWWDNLPIDAQAEFQDLTKSGSPVVERTAQHLLDDGKTHSNARVTELLTG
jgi:hypothetical protein